MKKKIKNLKILEVKSFVTSLDGESQLTKKILAGEQNHSLIIKVCDSDSNSHDIYSGS